MRPFQLLSVYTCLTALSGIGAAVLGEPILVGSFLAFLASMIFTILASDQ